MVFTKYTKEYSHKAPLVPFVNTFVAFVVKKTGILLLGVIEKVSMFYHPSLNQEHYRLRDVC